jgi:sulfate permease, SulP family
MSGDKNGSERSLPGRSLSRPTLRAAVVRLLPSGIDYAGISRTWRADVVAGVTVGVVALPLALAFGVTTGLGAAAGIITAIVAGLVAGIFGGSDVQVSGPTGAMTVVLAPIVAQNGTEAVAVVGVMAGLLVIAAAFAGLGRYLAYVPWPVVEGFTVGIAAIIFLQQVPAALGVTAGHGHNAAAVAIHALADTGAGDPAAIVLALVVVAVMVATPHIRRSLPASLIAILVATATAELTDLEVTRIGTLPASLPAPSLPDIAGGQIRSLASAALAVAVLAALESLLSARVADGMTAARRHDPDRELLGQGLANLAAPLFGGMPATGAIARTAVNVRAGARSRLATIVHALVLVGVVYFGAGLVARIPLAALAGVLMVTAARMVEFHNVRAVTRATRSDALVFAATTAATIAVDLIVAIQIGLAIATLLALRSVARATTATHQALDDPDSTASERLLDTGIISYRLDGALFFGAAQRFLTELTAVTDARVAILRLPDLQVLDATGAQALGEIVAELEARDITVLLKGVRPAHLRTLQAVGALDRLAHENHIFDDLDTAIAHARTHTSRLTCPTG